MQVCVFPKTQTDKHKGEIKTYQQRKKKIGKKRNPNNQNKNKYAQKVHLKNSCNKSLGKLKSRKILFDGKAVLLMVPWVRVDLDLFISLLSI
jgi:ribosomal protein L44E